MQEKDAATIGEATVHAGSRLTRSVKGRVLSHVNDHDTDGNNNVDLEGKPGVAWGWMLGQLAHQTKDQQQTR